MQRTCEQCFAIISGKSYVIGGLPSSDYGDHLAWHENQVNAWRRLVEMVNGFADIQSELIKTVETLLIAQAGEIPAAPERCKHLDLLEIRPHSDPDTHLWTCKACHKVFVSQVDAAEDAYNNDEGDAS